MAYRQPNGVGPADPRATSEVVASLIANVQALVTKEIELAKLEATQMAKEKGTAAALAAVAGILGLFILAFVGVTAAKALELVVAEWLAWLIVTAVYLVVTLIALFVAYRLVQRPAMERTKRTAEGTKEWATAQPETIKANLDAASGAPTAPGGAAATAAPPSPDVHTGSRATSDDPTERPRP